MPMPIELKVIDWKEVFKSGKTFADWIGIAENAQNAEAIEMMLKDQNFQPDVEARVKAVARSVNVVAIAEDWCPDVIRHVPVIERMSQLNDVIQVRYVARMDWPDVFERFLTVGGEAIPKFIFLSENFVECADWGPMPQDCREFIARGKAYGDNGKARKLVFEAYMNDPERKIPAREILHCVDIAASTAPF